MEMALGEKSSERRDFATFTPRASRFGDVGGAGMRVLGGRLVCYSEGFRVRSTMVFANLVVGFRT